MLALLSSCGSSSSTAAPPPAASPAGAPVTAENYQWKPVAIGGGGFITGYDADNSGTTRVARADVYGAYIWLGDQSRWAQLVTSNTMPDDMRIQDGANEGVYEVVVAPSDPDRIYMAIKGGIFRSDNRGKRFVHASPSTAPFPLVFDANSRYRHYGPFMAVAPDRPDLVLFGSPENGLWQSQNAGQTWTQITSVPYLKPAAGQVNQTPGIVIWFEKGPGGASTGRIWAVSYGLGVFVSSDDGRTFTPLSPSGSPQPKALRQGAFAPDGTFYGVDNAGQAVWQYRAGAWTNLTSRPGLSARAFGSVAINPTGGDIYVFDEGGRVFRSDNAGQNWSSVTRTISVGEGDPPWLRVNNISYFSTGMVRFDPFIRNRIWGATGVGVFYADMPAGTSSLKWISQTRGIEELVANDVIQPKGKPPLFAAWDFGIHVKPDLNAFSTTYGPKERVLISAQQLAWSDADPNFIVTNASDARMNCCSEDGQSVLAGYSLDGGTTWSRFATLPTPPGTSASDPWRMSFGTLAVAANDTKNIIWEPSFNRSPFYTKDRGQTWSKVVLPGETGPLTGSHSNYYFGRKTLTADRVQPGVFYLYHSGEAPNIALTGLWRTANGGATWERVYVGEIAPSSQFSAKLRAVPGQAGQLFFASGVSGISDTKLRRSIDGGRTWTMVERVDRVDDIAFGKAARDAAYPTIFISGKVGGVYGIWRSIDNATSWAQVGGFPVGTLDQVSVIGADPDVFGRVYVGYKGSSWIYGEPATCSAAAYTFPANSECRSVQP
jgi:photosystem II stability/assembly factor-like uncharacterized protein